MSKNYNPLSGAGIFDFTPLVAAGGYLTVVKDHDPCRLDKVLLPAGTKISARRQKIMTVTKVAGRKGTIKEISGFDDWQIDFSINLAAAAYSGLAVQFPTVSISAQGVDYAMPQNLIDQIKKLHELFAAKSAVPVYNERLNSIGITHLVLTDFDLPDNPSIYLQEVHISAVSDDDQGLAALMNLLSGSVGAVTRLLT
jgi:hypothetical protein